MIPDLASIDASFDFDAVYKRHHSTLLNISIIEVRPKLCLLVDEETQAIEYATNLYCIMYREWQNANWFPIQTNENCNMYWSTKELAKTWFDKVKVEHGLELLSRQKALEIAQSNFE